MLEHVGRDLHRETFFHRVLFDRLAADLGNLPLKPAYARFAGVITDDVADRFLVKADLAFLQAVGLNLLGREVFDGDVDLFVFGVARQANDFHPVQQRWRNVHRVRRAQEHHVRKIVVDLKVVIVEIVVLLGIKYLEQCRRRIATHVAAHLVDFVKQEQRVANTHLCHLLYQSSWHRTDISPAMTTNFSLVTHATQCHTHEFAIGRVGYGLGQGSFTHTRWTHQTQHRTTNFLHALLHGEVFEDAFLDLVQTVVVGIKNRFGARKIQTHLALRLPRHLNQPVDVGAHHGRFSRHRRHLLELVQLGICLGQSVLGQARSVDALFQLFDFVVAFVAIAELLLNGLHLLIQVVLALAALHLLLHTTANALFDLQQVDFGIQQGQHVLDTG